ncbi:D-lactate dehydrogenase [Paracoccus sp. MC1854]|uniref:D-lactate dehydrogenase n=1 Tax=Paracoccus sp. MC1854 TaxID=2760306 RepID=UPI0016043581|nr:D-lactate dehydrogenase [Paracoccus sp. MC1854]MBB1492506.1 D-lactate dehydrogenase [Paracoccus sp. MC1854]
MTQRSPTDFRPDPPSLEPGPAFLDALRAVVGPRHVLTRPQDTERFRMGYRSGGGEAEAVVRPGTLLELWQVLQLCVKAGRIVIAQAANTGLTEGSTPKGTYDRPVVIVNTLRLSRIDTILDGAQVVCHAGATLYDLERRLDPLGRDPHSVIGSSCIGASVVGGVCNNSGGALVRRGPAYTELALFARLEADGKLRLINNLGLRLGNDPEAILRRLDAGEIRPGDVDPRAGAASDHGYAERIRDVDAETPGRFNADPGRLYEASGCAGRLAVFAVRLDSFPRPAAAEVLYVGTNDAAALATLRRRLLTELDPLPIVGEYIHREAWDMAARFGRDTRLFIEWFGTARMPVMFALKGWADARLRKIPLTSDLSDRLLQFAGQLAPGRLPRRMRDFRNRFEHHLILRVEAPSDRAERILTETVGTDGWFRCTPAEGSKAMLHRFAVAGAAVRYEAMNRRRTGGLVALDVALRRNDRDWIKPVPPEWADKVAATLSYGHFLCHVFHLDYVLKKGADPTAFKKAMLAMLDAEGAEYPAEHNVGHLYHAKPQLAAFYEGLDPLARFNPGIGGTRRS